MQQISQSSLNSSVPSRLSYVQSFLSFDATDGKSIQASGPLLQPLIPALLDKIYTKLLTYDVTAVAFVPKLGHELDATDEPKSPQELTLRHPHIKRQMSFLRSYILRIAGNSEWGPEAPLWTFLDRVAVMHTGSPGFKYRERRPELRVEFMHMALLLGYLEDIIVEAVMGMETVELGTKVQVLRAWNKILWIQNDLFSRHYAKNVDELKNPAQEKGIWNRAGQAALAATGAIAAVCVMTWLR